MALRVASRRASTSLTSTAHHPIIRSGLSTRNASAMAVPLASSAESRHDISVWKGHFHAWSSSINMFSGRSLSADPRSSLRLCHCSNDRRARPVYGSNIRAPTTNDGQRRGMLSLGCRKSPISRLHGRYRCQCSGALRSGNGQTYVTASEVATFHRSKSSIDLRSYRLEH